MGRAGASFGYRSGMARADRPSAATTVAPRPNPAWERRKLAARKHRPATIRLLLVSDAPPGDEDRYFYFEHEGAADPLFDAVAAVIFEERPDVDRGTLLKELKRRGVFVIELKPDAPRAGEDLAPYADWLALTIDALAPERIVLVSSAVAKAAGTRLAAAGLPVDPDATPDPAEDAVGFRRELRAALVRAGLERLIRPRGPQRKTPKARPRDAAPADGAE